MCSFKLAAMKMTSPSKELLEQHYGDLSTKPFFPGLLACMSSIEKIIYLAFWSILMVD